MSRDKYAVGFVFGMTVGAWATSPQDTPKPVEQLQMEQRYVPQTVPLREAKEEMPVHQVYNPNDYFSLKM